MNNKTLEDMIREKRDLKKRFEDLGISIDCEDLKGWWCYHEADYC